MTNNITPRRLTVRLLAYYTVVITIVISLLLANADVLRYLPFGGSHALNISGVEATNISATTDRDLPAPRPPPVEVTPERIGTTVLFLAMMLLTTIVVMLPITWTYSATRYESGPSKVFVRSLLLMPICATTVVLLIQDSLSLAFGLAALVAAVRFRVALTETIDGIYIFTAICVGLAGGIGYMGIALAMTLIFTLTSAVLWQVDYGRNPIDDAREEALAAKLAAKGRRDADC
ncbi:MAG TPA: DUF4956 domain-containing protein [Woeseiaceae bacterium]|nr:DUF4956 domain-containing protein [Woeseiaceae bacterium]